MKCLKLLEIENINDLYKLILNGELICIERIDNEASTNWSFTDLKYVRFNHKIDDSSIYYSGCYDLKTGEFIRLYVDGFLIFDKEKKDGGNV